MKRSRRNFSSDFGKKIPESIMSDSPTQVEMARKYRVSLVLINRWKK